MMRVMKKRKKKKVKMRIVQHHHPDYSKPDFTVPIYRGEHWTVTKLSRKFNQSIHKKFSKGFLYSLHCLYVKYWDKAEDLEDFFNKDFY